MSVVRREHCFIKLSWMGFRLSLHLQNVADTNKVFLGYHKLMKKIVLLIVVALFPIWGILPIHQLSFWFSHGSG